MPPLTLTQLMLFARQHFDAGRLSEAEGLCHKILAGDAANAAALHLAGLIAEKKGRDEVASAYLQRAASAAPDNLQIASDLQRVCLTVGKRLAETVFQRAASKSDSDSGEQLDTTAADNPMIDAAISQFAAMLAQGAGNAEICARAAGAFLRRRHLDSAISTYRRVLELEPKHLAALNNLALALKDAGQIDQAIGCLRHAMAAHPTVSACHGNLLYTLHFHPDSHEDTLLAEHREWGKRHGSCTEADRLHADASLSRASDMTPSPLYSGERGSEISPKSRARLVSDRRLRIGYVSPNFSVHPVGRFMTSLMANHDHERFEIICYSSVRNPDAMTETFRRHADRWIDAVDLTDSALAEQIAADEIDILVDLTMHMSDGRLLTFARKPAPIQVSYLAYCSITGLDAMDYRLSDPYLDPPGSMLFAGAEKVIRLPESYWCYDPVIETPPVNDLPALSRGFVTFASLNNFCKVSPTALALWAKLLAATPGSRLMLHAHRGSHRDRVRQSFADAGVAPTRVEFVDMLPLAPYYELYQQIDLALDPFPYPGGTTTCDALWMGVPTISLVGRLPYMRSGLSILSNVGLPELAAESESEYLENAIALAGDLPRLAHLRSILREQMTNSPLMDGRRFARNVEAAFLSIASNASPRDFR